MIGTPDDVASGKGRPNLFGFATSELSQDAFVAWLLAWADPRYSGTDRRLHRSATRMLDQMLALAGVKPPDEYKSVLVERQRKHVDVLAIINERIAVIIEDKTHTSEHSNQLERYFKKFCSEHPDADIAAIYLKTGDQCDYSEVKLAGYSCFGRREFLGQLRAGRDAGITNHIYSDFLDHLEHLDAVVNSYRVIAPNGWGKDRNRWAGFFMALREQLGDGGWGYVDNPRGGFMGLWWRRANNKYLQLEEDRLCFKVLAENESDRRSIRDAWCDALVTQAKQFDLPVRRPDRRAIGSHMTAAVLDGDYRAVSATGLLDMDRTLATLRQAERLSAIDEI